MTLSAARSRRRRHPRTSRRAATNPGSEDTTSTSIDAHNRDNDPSLKTCSTACRTRQRRTRALSCRRNTKGSMDSAASDTRGIESGQIRIPRAIHWSQPVNGPALDLSSRATSFLYSGPIMRAQLEILADYIRGQNALRLGACGSRLGWRGPFSAPQASSVEA